MGLTLYSNSKYYNTYPYFTDSEAIKNGFNMKDVKHLTGKSGQIGVVDTIQNFHCGSRSKNERYLAILTFVPYLYLGRYDSPSLTGERSAYKKENEFILNYFK